jgi:hypothetical protein
MWKAIPAETDTPQTVGQHDAARAEFKRSCMTAYGYDVTR